MERKGARSPCCGRAAGLRSRGARRRISGFDCEAWRKRAGDSADSGLACTSFAPAPAITAGSRLRCPLVQERRRPRISSPLNFFPSHTHITSIHPRPSTTHATFTTHFQTSSKNRVKRPKSLEMAPKQAQVSSSTPNTRVFTRHLRRIHLTPIAEDSHHRRQGPGWQGSR